MPPPLRARIVVTCALFAVAGVALGGLPACSDRGDRPADGDRGAASTPHASVSTTSVSTTSARADDGDDTRSDRSDPSALVGALDDSVGLDPHQARCLREHLDGMEASRLEALLALATDGDLEESAATAAVEVFADCELGDLLVEGLRAGLTDTPRDRVRCLADALLDLDADLLVGLVELGRDPTVSPSPELSAALDASLDGCGIDPEAL